MENKTFFEKFFLCLGIIFLFIGLWNFIDFSHINKYFILSIIILLAIIFYIGANKRKNSSRRISLAFATISMGLSITSIIMLMILLKIESIVWLIIITIGIYLLLFLKEFTSKYLYFIGGIYSFFALNVLLGREKILSSFVLGIFIIMYSCSIVKGYIENYKENKLLSISQGFITVSVVNSLLYYIAEYILRAIPSVYINPTPIITVILVGILIFILNYSNLNLPSGFAKIYGFFIGLFSLCFTNRFYWQELFPRSISILISILFAVFIIYILIVKILNGHKKSFWLLLLQSVNIIFSNLYGLVSMSVFLMILGAVLISIAICLDKNKIRIKGGDNNG